MESPLFLGLKSFSIKIFISRKSLSASEIWNSEAGEQLKQVVTSLTDSSGRYGKLDSVSYEATVDSFLGAIVYRPKYGGHTRLKILSPIEARLLDFDRVIVGSFNDGDWPALSIDDAWASNFMRKSLGLPTIEKRIGQAAHDFAAFLCKKEVLSPVRKRMVAHQPLNRVG